MMMREGRVERFLLLPFSIRCDSKSSVALATTATGNYPPKRSKTRQKARHDNLSELKFEKKQIVSKASFSQKLHSLIQRFKSISQFFVYKEEVEHLQEEIEIGFPTDVKHVTHIGLDGSTTVNPIPNWENLKAAEIVSFPSVSLKQFELAMAAQSQGNNGSH